MRSQKANMPHLNIKYPINMTKGTMHMMAKVENPAVTNWYMAKKNRRKSINTLPPFSREYATT